MEPSANNIKPWWIDGRTTKIVFFIANLLISLVYVWFFYFISDSVVGCPAMLGMVCEHSFANIMDYFLPLLPILLVLLGVLWAPFFLAVYLKNIKAKRTFSIINIFLLVALLVALGVLLFE